MRIIQRNKKRKGRKNKKKNNKAMMIPQEQD
jgi:hypothetical protein